jgi:uncharacterized protein YqkB
MALDEPKQNDQEFSHGTSDKKVTILIDRATDIYLDDPMRLDYDKKERVYLLRSSNSALVHRMRL